jgi:phosphoribosylanthranilate isomerase
VSLEVKICGLRTREAVDAAVGSGARFVGFVFFPPSPRSLSAAEAATLVADIPSRVTRVGLFVDAEDAYLEQILSRVDLDMLQFHGSEPPQRIFEVKQRWSLPLMKAIPVARSDDLERAQDYEKLADRLLFDARPPEGADRPGGNARTFDWTLLKDRNWQLPWLLAGGVNAGNVVEAARLSGATAVDVSSGVEDAPGVKNLDKIREFLRVAHGA